MSRMIRAIRSGHPATLFAAFLYFDVSFMVWVLIGALGVFVSGDLRLSAAQKGIVVSVPLLGGAFFRVLTGFLVDRFGPRKVGILSLAIVLVPLTWGWLGAGSYTQTIGVGFLLGVAGASFAVALPLASRCYPPEHQGVALGIAGAGNSGTMIAVLAAPFLAERYGWHAVFGLAILPVLATFLVFCKCAKEYGDLPSSTPFADVLSLLRAPDFWTFSSYYAVTFGGFVGMASFLGIFLHDAYGVRPVLAGALTALCVFAGSFVRPIGGYWADRVGGVRLLIGLYAAVAVLFLALAAAPPLPIAVACIFLGMAALGLGNGAIFQEVPQRFPDSMGFVAGFVGACGGLGGFFLPTLLGAMKGWTDAFSGGFLCFAAAAMACAVATSIQCFRRPIRAQAAIHIAVDDGRVPMEVVFGG